jgi:hypothetical protein
MRWQLAGGLVALAGGGVGCVEGGVVEPSGPGPNPVVMPGDNSPPTVTIVTPTEGQLSRSPPPPGHRSRWSPT